MIIYGLTVKTVLYVTNFIHLGVNKFLKLTFPYVIRRNNFSFLLSAAYKHAKMFQMLKCLPKFLEMHFPSNWSRSLILGLVKPILPHFSTTLERSISNCNPTLKYFNTSYCLKNTKCFKRQGLAFLLT